MQPSAEDLALITASGLLDEAHYRAQTSLPPGTDLARHYLEAGWSWGLEPRPGFDSRFVTPYYKAAGFDGAPLLTWVEMSAIAGRLPVTEGEAQWRAERIRPSDRFDAAWYAKRLPPNMDPALHYVVIGEAMGWRPSPLFDPNFYRERHVDVANLGLSPLLHWVEMGHREGRLPRAAVERLDFPKIPPRNGRRTVLVVAHEASRSGAPLLAWSIAGQLAARYDVISVLLNKGVLEPDFAAISAAVVGPMRWEEWHPAEMSRLASRLVAEYDPLYAIANSIETSQLIPALAARGVPSVALIHEFAAYTRPYSKLNDAFDWASDIVFPANIVAQSSYHVSPHLTRRRGVHIFPQGRVDPPKQDTGAPAAEPQSIRPPGAEAAFIVLAAASVQIRKGTDVFFSVAAASRRMAPDLDIRFAWIGDGYDPVKDPLYSAYLAEQYDRAGLAPFVTMLDSVTDLDPAYAAADLFLLSSRLDPQPNVAIDALSRGLPVICFRDACGTAEILSRDPATASLVAPHLDAEGAAAIIVGLARDRERHATIRQAVKQVAALAFDMDTYVARVDTLGRAAAASLAPDDRTLLARSGLLDQDLMLPPGAFADGGMDGLATIALQQWSTVRTSLDQHANPYFRRPCAGFNPQAYGEAHPQDCVQAGANPLAHWLRAGRPPGGWCHAVLPLLPGPAASMARAALHGHFHYPEMALDLRARLQANATPCDLFLTTDTPAKAQQLHAVFTAWPAALDVSIVPNRGRDIGPFLSMLNTIEGRNYDLIGHIHGKRSLGVDAAMGEAWCSFLWDNLIGPTPVIDTVAAAILASPALGLVIAEDPHLVGWDDNRPAAEALCARMAIPTPLPTFFDFPLGTMFWARPAALAPLTALQLDWNDYPPEPLPNDGTILHAIERLIPFAARHAGFQMAAIRVPGTAW